MHLLGTADWLGFESISLVIQFSIQRELSNASLGVVYANHVPTGSLLKGLVTACPRRATGLSTRVFGASIDWSRRAVDRGRLVSHTRGEVA